MTNIAPKSKAPCRFVKSDSLSHTTDASEWEKDWLLTPASVSSNRLHGGANLPPPAPTHRGKWQFGHDKGTKMTTARQLSLSLAGSSNAWIFNRERAGRDAPATFLIHTNMPEVRHTLNPKFGLSRSEHSSRCRNLRERRWGNILVEFERKIPCIA